MAITEVGSATNGASTGTDANVTHGLTILSGDVVVASVGSNVGSGGGITDNNGGTPFTVDFDAQVSGSSDSWELIGHRVSAGSEPSAYHWTVPNDRWSVIIRVFRGVHADVWDVAPSGSPAFGNGTVATANAITTLTADALALFIAVADDSAKTFSGQTSGYGAEVERADQSQCTYTKTVSAPGDIGTAEVTMSNPGDDWQAWQCALKSGAVTIPEPLHVGGWVAPWKQIHPSRIGGER